MTRIENEVSVFSLPLLGNASHSVNPHASKIKAGNGQREAHGEFFAA